jgi:hypothetical protein
VLDQEGNVIGKVTLVHEGFGGLPELPEIPSLDILEGFKVNKKGDVLNEDGEVIASLSWGKLADVKGKMINEKGEVLDTEGKVIGKVELVPEAFGITQEQLEQARKIASDREESSIQGSSTNPPLDDQAAAQAEAERLELEEKIASLQNELERKERENRQSLAKLRQERKAEAEHQQKMVQMLRERDHQWDL